MYNPSVFAEDRIEVLHELIRACPLATLISSREGRIECSHIPMFLDAAENSLRAHIARANPHWESLDGAEVLSVFHGPEHYVSPSWYPSKREHGKVVPTWNYAVVHIRGRARVATDSEFLLRNLTELTAHNERQFAAPWAVTDAPEDYIRGLTRSIAGIEISITGIEGKWKISQNRAADDRAGVKAGLAGLGASRSSAMLQIMEHEPEI